MRPLLYLNAHQAINLNEALCMCARSLFLSKDLHQVKLDANCGKSSRGVFIFQERELFFYFISPLDRYAAGSDLI